MVILYGFRDRSLLTSGGGPDLTIGKFTSVYECSTCLGLCNRLPNSRHLNRHEYSTLETGHSCMGDCEVYRLIHVSLDEKNCSLFENNTYMTL